MNLLALRMTLKAFASFENTNALNEFCQSYDDVKAQSDPLSFDEDMTDEQKYSQIYGYKRKNITELLEKYCLVAAYYHVLVEKTKFVEILKTDDDHNMLMELILRGIVTRVTR